MRRPGNKFRWRSAVKRQGETVLIRRYTGSGTNRPRFDVSVRGRVNGYEPSQLIGSITQGDRRVLILQEDLIKAQFALPITSSDKCVVRGRELAIQAADDNTHRDGTELIAWELQVRG
jgi:hypothetical protein